jgi:hypothetical protein
MSDAMNSDQGSKDMSDELEVLTFDLHGETLA